MVTPWSDLEIRTKMVGVTCPMCATSHLLASRPVTKKNEHSNVRISCIDCGWSVYRIITASRPEDLRAYERLVGKQPNTHPF